jgi:hypothetical protein
MHWNMFPDENQRYLMEQRALWIQRAIMCASPAK